MSPRFVSLHGIVVLLTVLFFQFLPVPEMLSWEELLLSKFLNQAPTLLCLGYFLFHRKRVHDSLSYFLLIAFLFLEILVEIYYYFVSTGSLFVANLINDILAFVVLFVLYNQQRLRLRASGIYNKKLGYVIFACFIVALGFSFSLSKAYKIYFSSEKLIFFLIMVEMALNIITVGISFYVNGPLSRNRYRLAVGTIAIVTLKIYLYLSRFVFEVYPAFAFTIGKIIFSMGILLIADSIMRKCMVKKNAPVFIPR
ncbi:hypothetical protein [Emticicia fluvialis]|uniref:hypothetical protein n=1 Tax=Emticicia fluvialis TaxID=2974474 RepID=UPI0021652ECB|nr:hypothetical protein [Emticicia fluvialis]